MPKNINIMDTLDNLDYWLDPEHLGRHGKDEDLPAIEWRLCRALGRVINRQKIVATRASHPTSPSKLPRVSKRRRVALSTR